MEQLAILLLSLPNPVAAAIFGAVGGAIGSLVIVGIGKLLKLQRNAVTIGAAISLALGVQASGKALSWVKESYGDAAVVDQLKKMRLYRVIFRVHPEAEREMREGMRAVTRGPADQVRLQAQNMSGAIVTRYFLQHLVAAPDDVTHSVLLRNRAVMRQFQRDRPELCVGYYLGRFNQSVADLGEDFLTAESNLKADVIESALANPSLPARAATLESILDEVAAGYIQKQYPIEALAKIDKVESMPPAEGCVVAIMLVDVLASMPAKQGAHVFKNLLYLSQEP